MKYKVKKVLCVLLTLSIILTLCPFEAPKKVKASTPEVLSPLEYKGHLFSLTYTVESHSIDLNISISRFAAGASSITFPSMKEIKDRYSSELSNLSNLPFTLNANFDKNIVSGPDIQEITFEAGYTSIGDNASTIFANASKLKIENTDTITLKEKCFQRMSLNDIEIHATNLIFKGLCFSENAALTEANFNASNIYFSGASNFSNCSQLDKLTFSANNIYIQGPYNFTACPKLTETTFNGNTQIENSSFLFEGSENAVINFKNSLTTFGTVFTASNNTINIYGQSNNIGAGFISGASIKNLVISGHYEENSGSDSVNSRTKFATGAIQQHASISSFEIYSSVTFENQTIQNSKITDLLISVDNRDGHNNITYASSNDRLGYYSTVTNLIFANNDSCKELTNFPLGGGDGDKSETSLNFENIYFLNRNFQHIENSSYGRSSENPGVTHVYGYGAGKAYDTDYDIITAYTMYEGWCIDNGCEYTNYDSLSTVIPDVTLYLNDNDSATLEYDSKLVIEITHLNEDGSDSKQSPSPLYFTGRDFGQTNKPDNYHILVPTTDSVNRSQQLVYTYEDKNYIVSHNNSIEFTKLGTYLLFAEVCGCFYPFHVNVKECSIQSINDVRPSSEHALDLNVGEKVTPDMLIVDVTYVNGKTGYASPDEYSITLPNNVIQEGTNTCTISLENQNETGIKQRTIVATGYPDVATDFTIRCNKTNDDGTITLNEGDILKSTNQKTASAILSLEDIKYINPFKEPEATDEGFKFIVGNQELDTYKISVGQNDVRIRYKSLEKTITIFGIQSDVKSISAEYIGKGAYEGFTEVPLSDVKVTITRENDTTEIVKDTSLYCIESDYVIKRNENNFLTVIYKGASNSKTLKATICVNGLPNTVKELTNVVYEGSDHVGTKINLDDFNFSIIMDSGEVLNSSTSKALKANLTLKETDEIELHEGNNFFRIYYEDTANNKFVSSKVSIIGISNSPTADINATPNSQEKDPTTVTVTENPNTSGHTATAVPNVTPTATPLPVSKGKTYTVKNIKYKVLSFNGKSGTVTATGYSKSAKSIAVANYVYIKGYKFTVKSISNNAFKNCSSLKGTVKINGSISKIGNNAFIGCKKIKKIVIGKNITSVGSKAFYNCKSLSFVDLRQAKSLKKIGASSFKKNKKGRLFKVKPSTKQYFIYLLKGKY